MGIKETIAALDALAATSRETPAESADDIEEARFLLASCDVRLSDAAFHHMMGRFCRAAGIGS